MERHALCPDIARVYHFSDPAVDWTLRLQLHKSHQNFLDPSSGFCFISRHFSCQCVELGWYQEQDWWRASGESGPPLFLWNESYRKKKLFWERKPSAGDGWCHGSAILSRINRIKGNVSHFPLGAANSSCFSFYRVTPHCCLFRPRTTCEFYARAVFLRWHSPMTSFPHRLCLCYNRFLVVVVAAAALGVRSCIS